MFEELVLGSYEMLYGTILSGFAHGGLTANLSRIKYNSPSNVKIIAGCEYNKKLAQYVMLQTLHFGYGFLNYADEFFPMLSAKMPRDIVEKKKSYLREYKETMLDPHKEEFFEKILLPFIER